MRPEPPEGHSPDTGAGLVCSLGELPPATQPQMHARGPHSHQRPRGTVSSDTRMMPPPRAPRAWRRPLFPAGPASGLPPLQGSAWGPA